MRILFSVCLALASITMASSRIVLKPQSTSGVWALGDVKWTGDTGHVGGKCKLQAVVTYSSDLPQGAYASISFHMVGDHPITLTPSKGESRLITVGTDQVGPNHPVTVVYYIQAEELSFSPTMLTGYAVLHDASQMTHIEGEDSEGRVTNRTQKLLTVTNF
jgi:hypothetical protein